jgi:hypothetical protein
LIDANKPVIVPKIHGAHNQTRTGDLFLTKEVLYRLSYVGIALSVLVILERVMGIEPTPSAWKAEVLPLNYTRIWFFLANSTFVELGLKAPS